MKKTMKPNEIMRTINQIGKVVEREENYFEKTAKTKFTPKVAVSIAKNRKNLTKELESIIDVEKKNKKMAEKRGVDLKDIEEQKQLMDTEFEIEINMISHDDLGECHDMTSSDYFDMEFMVEDR